MSGALSLRKGLLVLFSALVLLGGPLPGAARADEDTAESHAEEGARLYQDKQYEPAIKEFQTAYNQSPQPSYLFNIGQAYKRLGLSQEATDFFERYLQEEPKIDPTIRADLLSYIAQAQAAQGVSQRRKVDGGDPEPPPPLVADEVVDAEELFDQAVKEYKAGNVAVSNDLLAQLRDVYAQRRDPLILYYFGQAYEKMGRKKEALESYERYVEAEPSDQQRRAQAAARVSALTPAPPGQKFLWPSLALGVVGIGGVVTGIVFFTQASSNFDSYNMPGNEVDKRGLRDNGNSLSLGSIIGYSVGGGLLAGAATFLTVALVKGVKSKPLALPKLDAPGRTDGLGMGTGLDLNLGMGLVPTRGGGMFILRGAF